MSRPFTVPVRRAAAPLLAVLALAGAAGCTSSQAAPSGPAATAAPATSAPKTTTTTTTEDVTEDEGTTEDEVTTTTKASGKATTTAAGQQYGVDEDGLVEDAEQMRTYLFSFVTSWGEQALDLEAVRTGWNGVYPTVKLAGYEVEAQPDKISVLANTVDDKDVASTTNPYVFAFAVKDVSGTCLGGVVYGYPAPTSTLELAAEPGDACKASAVMAAVGPKLSGG